MEKFQGLQTCEKHYVTTCYTVFKKLRFKATPWKLGVGSLYNICTAYCMRNDVYLYCLLYSHHYAKFGLFTRERNLLMSPRHPYSCTEEVTSKGTVIHWLCSTAMSVNMLVQMRECPPDMCLTELLPGEKGT